MAKKAFVWQQRLQIWWVRVALILIYFGVAYAWVSLAIDSGSLLSYTAAILFMVLAFKQIHQIIRLTFRH